ncbi:MAG TPA: hypothetical protein VNN77_07090 [candidate division Zixibacteria bacterium]|nr:hypothetical protein [candidate division Zixibacteria bacterium]
MSLWSETRKELDAFVNRHFDTPEYRQFFGVKLTPEREKILNLHYPHYIKSRRDCWAAASVKAPLDVKRAIWEHEKDELIYDPRMGSAHLTDAQMAEATAETNLLPGARAAMFAWMYLATTRPWLEALMVNHVTERKNNPAIVKGGGFTQRFAHKKVADLGGTIETLDINTRVHMVADEDHSDMFEPIFERYVLDQDAARAVLRAAADSLAIDRAYRSALATAMAQIPD